MVLASAVHAGIVFAVFVEAEFHFGGERPFFGADARPVVLSVVPSTVVEIFDFAVKRRVHVAVAFVGIAVGDAFLYVVDAIFGDALEGVVVVGRNGSGDSAERAVHEIGGDGSGEIEEAHGGGLGDVGVGFGEIVERLLFVRGIFVVGLLREGIGGVFDAILQFVKFVEPSDMFLFLFKGVENVDQAGERSGKFLGQFCILSLLFEDLFRDFYAGILGDADTGSAFVGENGGKDRKALRGLVLQALQQVCGNGRVGDEVGERDVGLRIALSL